MKKMYSVLALLLVMAFALGACSTATDTPEAVQPVAPTEKPTEKPTDVPAERRHAEMIYTACADFNGNEDTAASNMDLNYTVSVAPPNPTNFDPPDDVIAEMSE